MRTPLEELAPGSTCNTLAPMVAIRSRMATALPWPISIMAMTAAMPMMMPRQVNADRIKLRRSARVEMRMTSSKQRTAAKGDSRADSRDGCRRTRFGSFASASGFDSAITGGNGAKLLMDENDSTTSLCTLEAPAVR